MKQGSEFKLEEVKELISKGKEEGVLAKEEISETLSEIDLTTEQIDNIYDVIQNLGIEIISDEDEDIDSVMQRKKDEDILKAGKFDLGMKSPTNDPVRMYLKEIGKVRLLTAAEEVQLAKKIEVGDMDAKRRLVEACSCCDSKAVLHCLNRLYRT